MGNRIVADLAALASAIVGLAIVAVIVASKANTDKVITAAGTALATDLKAAVGVS